MNSTTYIPCDFCGLLSSTVHKQHKPENNIELHLNFCSDRCTSKLLDYYIYDDLSHGVPYRVRQHLKIENWKPLVCLYCGANDNVIINPRTPSFIKINGES